MQTLISFFEGEVAIDCNDDDDGTAPAERLLRIVPPRCSVTTLTAVDVVVRVKGTG